jgi:transcriptional regulator with XRE-family HTH domain
MATFGWYFTGDMAKRSRKKSTPEFGRRVAAARRERGMTQSQLGNVLGISQKMIDYYERRASNVTADILKRLSNVLGVSSDELLGINSKKAKPGPKSKLRRQIEQIEQLPKAKQQAISEILDMAVKSRDAKDQ